MKRRISILISISLVLTAAAQVTQQGVVQEYNEKAAKTPLAGVELNVRSAGNAVSDKSGQFALEFQTLKPGDYVAVRRIEKLGYEIFNKEAVEQWNINPDRPFTVVMCRSDRFRQLRDNYEKVVSESYARQLKKDRAALDRLKAEGKLKEEEYRKEYQRLLDNYEKQLDNLNSYVDRFSRIDLSELTAAEQEIIELVKAGKMDEAIVRYDRLRIVDNLLEEIHKRDEVRAALSRLKKEKRSLAASNDSLYAMADRHIQTLMLAGGQENNQKVLSIYRKIADADTTNIDWLIKTGDFIKNFSADYDIALDYYNKAFGSSLRQNGETHPLTCKALTCIGEIYIVTMEYPKAMEYFTKALDQWQRIGDNEHPDLAQLYNDLGVISRLTGDYQKAIDYYLKALPIWERTRGKEDIYVTTVHYNIGVAYQSLGEFDKASDQFKMTLEMSEKQKGSLYVIAAFSYNGLATNSFYIGDYADAIEYIEKAIGIFENAMTVSESKLALFYDNAGSFFSAVGDYDKGMEMYDKALTIRQGIFDENNLNFAASYSNIGALYNKTGDYDKAIDYLSKTLKIQKSNLPSDNPEIAVSYCNLGLAYDNLEEHDKALDCYFNALEILKDKGEDSADVPTIYGNIASAYNGKGDYNKALDYHRKVLAIRKTTDPETVLTYNNIAMVYVNQGDYSKALELYSKALSICHDISLNPEHPYYSIIIENMEAVKSLVEDQ